MPSLIKVKILLCRGSAQKIVTDNRKQLQIKTIIPQNFIQNHHPKNINPQTINNKEKFRNFALQIKGIIQC